MTRILAIANQKGGVGKTTTAVNLAASLTAMKRRVLLVDLDPQGNATTGAGIDKRALAATVYHVLLGERAIADVRVVSPTGGFDVVPANRELAGAEVELVELPERETRLKSRPRGSAAADARGDFASRAGLRFRPARLPAVIVAPYAERALRGRRGADTDAVRVLRARRAVRSRRRR